jgi:hypothetical protein
LHMDACSWTSPVLLQVVDAVVEEGLGHGATARGY